MARPPGWPIALEEGLGALVERPVWTRPDLHDVFVQPHDNLLLTLGVTLLAEAAIRHIAATPSCAGIPLPRHRRCPHPWP